MNLLCSSRFVNPKNAMMPVSMALLLFMIQKAPPMMRMNTMMPLCFSKPLKSAENTCQVCGSAWNSEA